VHEKEYIKIREICERNGCKIAVIGSSRLF